MYKILENKVSNSNKRIYFIASSKNNPGRENAVIIELKQGQTLNKLKREMESLKPS